MLRRLTLVAPLLTSLAVVYACSDTGGGPGPEGTSGSAGASTGGTKATSMGGTSATSGGSSNTGGTNVSAGGKGGSATTGGVGPGTGGAATTGGSGGGGPATGGAATTGGSGPGTGGSGTTGGSSTTGGGSSTGGTANTGGGGGAATGGSGPDVDKGGKMNATPGATTSTPEDYLRIGEIRLLNNNWGSAELGCNAPMSVFINQDRTFGWSFNRGDCDTAGSNQNPDFPQVEFGIHPFGIGNQLVTSPEFTSTTLLPLQIKDIQSASVSVENLVATFQSESSWNITFEFWLSERHPVTDPNPGVHTELMTFWGWQAGRWPEPPGGTGPTGNGAGNEVMSGGKTYRLWVQDDSWADGWRYYQFRANDGPQKNFNGTLDVKPFLDYLVNSRQYSPDLWVTRLEVGSEIDDNTQGTVQMSGITFEVNGESRSEVIAN